MSETPDTETDVGWYHPTPVGKPYTEADVELARKAMREAPPCPEWLATEPALAGMPCEHCESLAVLDALTAAGWRPPA
ncbi:hypothetical protein GCM10011608_11130 [Micromonospora sonchi]|uniref:Uncharacterized protein n=1 Tax=Micromonospora sonchi TaxID=1763543 RepID=A0A917WTT1_9ACTN|nr:hypothetical protein [Micromonospora sonchi]GGM28038.1 hypothetical protein GCM10011608_11130 [Micromonospora sonchi]